MRQSPWTPEQYQAAHQLSLSQTQARVAQDAKATETLKSDFETLQRVHAELQARIPKDTTFES